MIKMAESIEISMVNSVISSLETVFLEEEFMKHVICPICKGESVRTGRNKSGSQRWICRTCSITFTPKIDNSAKQLKVFLNWLFGKKTQKEMP